MGVDGFTLPALLRLWNSQCSHLKPDLITILIGVNDVGVIKNTDANAAFALEEFKIGCKTLIERIQDQCSCLIILMEPFIFPHPDEYRLWKPELAKISNILREISSEYSLTFIPLWDSLLLAAKKYGYDAITLDGIHLTDAGHAILEDSWLTAYHKFQTDHA